MKKKISRFVIACFLCAFLIQSHAVVKAAEKNTIIAAAVSLEASETMENGSVLEPISSVSQTTNKTSAKVFKKMSQAEFINKIGIIAKNDYKKSGILPSVTIAQAILESGWGKSKLAQNANNLFGMKTSLSKNTWSGSTWNKKSKYIIRTAEYTKSNKKYYIKAAFRKYTSVEQSIADHSAYLVGAKKGSSKRYKGLTATKSYKKQLTIIKKGGYATSSTYVSQLTKIIKKYNLTQFDR